MSDPTHGRGCPCPRCEKRRARQRTYNHGSTVRYTPPTIQPANVRTYGEPWDSIITAGAMAAVPPTGLPRNGDKIKGGER